MTDPFPTADHDQHPAPIYSGPVAHLVRVQVDHHRWIELPPGDMIARYLIGVTPLEPCQ